MDFKRFLDIKLVWSLNFDLKIAGSGSILDRVESPLIRHWFISVAITITIMVSRCCPTPTTNEAMTLSFGSQNFANNTGG